jgi:hypothetical protein
MYWKRAMLAAMVEGNEDPNNSRSWHKELYA